MQSTDPLVFAAGVGAGSGAVHRGILNVTPMRSDGGSYRAARTPCRRLPLADEGAEVIDVGGESTRPGSLPVAAAEQIGASSRSSANGRRFGANGPAISVDTRWPRWRGGRGRGSGGGQRVSGLRDEPI